MERVLVRFYDRTNLGDDLLVQLLARRYQNRFSVLLREDCKALDELPNVDARRPRSSSLFARLRRRFSRRRPAYNADLLRAARSHDLMVYVGGSIFIEHPGKLETWHREREFYRALGIDYVIIDANFGPYQSADFPGIVSDILSGADDVCFRDRASRERFAAVATVRGAADIGFLAVPPPRPPEQHADVVFSVIDLTDRGDGAAAYESAMAAMVTDAVRAGSRVCLMSFCRYQHDDEAAARILAAVPASESPGVFRYDYDGDLDEALAIIGDADTIVGARFHAIVLGLAFGKAVVPIAYSRKTLDALADAGFGGTIVDLTVPTGASPTDVEPWTMPEQDRRRLRSEAERQFAVLDQRLVRAHPELAPAPLPAASGSDG